MRTPLVRVVMPSIYRTNGLPVPLPSRMAIATPDTRRALLSLRTALHAAGGDLILSDLFRSYDMQLQSHNDYVTGKKSAFSPPPGGSMHEAVRGFDLDLAALKIKLADFWDLASEFGVFPIISKPLGKANEAWHFDVRGSHALVYDYYRAGQGGNMKPYTAMAVSAILAVGIRVDAFGDRQDEAFLQSGLIRLGYDLGSIDGNIGAKTHAALQAAGIPIGPVPDMVTAVEHQLQVKFPIEFEPPELMVVDRRNVRQVA
ncbi:hypothetical protein [Azospirillum soli]|uniref:hypothetical protein n=1 Tax=Azospirillum soli TaxID=1304799 RepID=UPI001AE85350|nr:hypothetical protein [Azospirillum soli]MBP2316817.1 hypothetical protein [Azospirillum soli]